ncbi:MAG: type I DNA topoisomerase [Patescibacteria group bacterium]|jgi:DNA topoisomerase-1
MKLVIVESPTKAKTISRFLGKDYKVDSSYGHVRDLPKSKLGVDIEHDFAPQYVIFRKNQKRLTALKKLAAKAKEVYYATDEDREGEAIAWHLSQIFDIPKENERRIAFHEITKGAVEDAIEHPRDIDLNLVDAQQARRVLDRLVGYKLSPFLWKKVARGLSAGRVQSVAVRLIVEREREIEKFNKEEYWTVEADFQKKEDGSLHAKLHRVDGKILDKLGIKTDKQAGEILDQLKNAKYEVVKVEKKRSTRQPLPPFTTSTLQQEANRRLGYSAKQIMMLAQQLYEGIDVKGEGHSGLITYMRTDSVNLSEKFLGEAEDYIKESIGKEYVSGPRHFKTKSKGAQEAHEAIRPSEVSRTPDSVKDHLTAQQFKLYDLIWRRAVASQMTEAAIDSTVVDIANDDKKYTFRATGQVIRFVGWLAVYPNKSEDVILPDLVQGGNVDLLKLEPLQHFTQPPARYSDATLVRALEDRGIGRPSTYAPTIATIIDRGYVIREEKKLQPTEIAFLVNDLLVEHFPKIVDYDFTAKMESDLDEVAEGSLKWQPVIAEFYGPFTDNLEKKYEQLDKKDIIKEETDEICEKCGKPMAVKFGRFGKFLACTGFPECKNTKQINGKGEILEEEKIDEACPNCGKPMVYKQGRFGRFIACSDYPACKTTKKVLKTIGVKCPECKEGEVVIRRGRGRVFYGCSRYPECKFASSKKPGEEAVEEENKKDIRES